MNQGFIELFRPLLRYRSDPNFREFVSLAWSYASVRHESTEIQAANHLFSVPDPASFVWQFHDIFVERFYQFQALNPSPKILDLGANLGLASWFFLTHYPKAIIHSYEADSTICQFFSKNLPPQEYPNISLYQEAVAATTSILNFDSTGADDGKINAFGKHQVQGRAFPEILDRIGGKASLIKMDIEGAEFEIISEHWKLFQHTDYLFLEVHEDENQNFSQILPLLHQAGLQLIHITPQRRIGAPFQFYGQSGRGLFNAFFRNGSLE